MAATTRNDHFGRWYGSHADLSIFFEPHFQAQDYVKQFLKPQFENAEQASALAAQHESPPRSTDLRVTTSHFNLAIMEMDSKIHDLVTTNGSDLLQCVGQITPLHDEVKLVHEKLDALGGRALECV